MADKEKEPPSQSKSLPDSDSSDDTKVNPRFKTSVEERQYNNIPGSATATCLALSYSKAQVNPTVEDLFTLDFQCGGPLHFIFIGSHKLYIIKCTFIMNIAL